MKEKNQLGFTHCFEAATQEGAPALLLLHGSGGNETSLVGVGRAIAPGAALLSPQGNASDHGYARFFARLSESCQAKVEVAARISELSEFVRAAMKHYKLRQPFVVVGFSHGATVALHLLLHTKMKFAGAILMRPIPSEGDFSAQHLDGTPVLMLCGLNDPLVQSDQVEELVIQLRGAHATITLHWEEAGHNLSQGDVLMAFDWIRRFYAMPKPKQSQSKLK